MTKIQNYKLKSKSFWFFAVVFCFLFFVFGFTNAAVLYLEPSQGEYRQGDTFIVNVRIDAEEECVNAIQADLEFPKDSLGVKDVSKGNSIISFWVKEPEFSNENGFISFTGGIPGGYCGPLPGDPGQSNLLGKIIFKVKDGREQFSATAISDKDGRDKDGREQFSATSAAAIFDIAVVKFSDASQVLLNDGMGTPTKLSVQGAIFSIKEDQPSDEGKFLKDDWQKELEEDKIFPEPFEIQIHQDSLIFGGKYFVVFFTTDKQTGIDRYEIKEGKKDWKIAASPYLLEDQGLQTIIKVKAVDKSGNERIAEYTPLAAKKPFPYRITIFIIAILMIVIWILLKGARSPYHKSYENYK